MLSEWDPLINIGVALFKRDLEKQTKTGVGQTFHYQFASSVSCVWCQCGQFVMSQNFSRQLILCSSLWLFQVYAPSVQKATMINEHVSPLTRSLNSICQYNHSLTTICIMCGASVANLFYLTAANSLAEFMGGEDTVWEKCIRQQQESKDNNFKFGADRIFYYIFRASDRAVGVKECMTQVFDMVIFTFLTSSQIYPRKTLTDIWWY